MKCQSLTGTASRSHKVKSVEVHMTHRGGVNRRTDRWIFKTFLPGLRTQSKILMDFWILQLQRKADSSIFWAGYRTLGVIRIFLPGFRIQGENLTADLVNKS